MAIKSSVHNKKRNVGIIYEQLMIKIASAVVNNDTKRVSLLLNIIKNNFVPGTELYKEFRLFNALVKTSVSSEQIAAKILVEARNAARVHDSTKLTSEKSKLIKEINHGLIDETFYTTKIADYRTYATIQTLLNDWRNDTITEIARIASYEDQILQWLLKDKSVKDELKTEAVDQLALDIMRNKVNKKYTASLTSDQTSLLREHTFRNDVNTSDFTRRLENIKNHAQTMLTKYRQTCDNDFVKEKIPLTEQFVQTLDTSDHSDSNVAKYMTVVKLCNEIESDDNE